MRGNACGMCMNPNAIEDYYEGEKAKLAKTDLDKYYDGMGKAMKNLTEQTKELKKLILAYIDKEITNDDCKNIKDTFDSFIDSVMPCENAANCTAEVKEK